MPPPHRMARAPAWPCGGGSSAVLFMPMPQGCSVGVFGGGAATPNFMQLPSGTTAAAMTQYVSHWHGAGMRKPCGTGGE
ncbi:hypothetical protein CSR02_06275 [Acetobacter pomorum]|uniref:Uncharacterized protein n=1 Tax=Acetobacter pomorum TaxID=65959 RepID=A0A2G4RCI1_9PROT|nr:hypothetical protein [Acetobacter pomorum]PHY94262.1 hypothetical protein CSR02_06275 [Acetobacter pomorum]